MKRLLILLASLVLVGPVYGATPLTEEEKRGLVGVYRFEGDLVGWHWRNTTIELTLLQEDDGKVIGNERLKNSRVTKGKWRKDKEVLLMFRRISADEWIREWKVRSLNGDRCDKDRLCFVSRNSVDWESPYSSREFSLWQFSFDYQEAQAYSLREKGVAGWLGPAFVRISDPEQSSTTVASTETTQKPEPTQTTDSSLDLEFWKSIRGSGNPNLFRAYLRKFPDGEFVIIAEAKIKELGDADISVAQASIPNLDYGRYHALVIGNNNYRHLSDLETAINDANAIGRVLREDYGFAVKVLTNATRTDILDTFSQYRRKVSAKDNLLIYFAGHGHLDRDMDEGYWLPIDAVEDSFTNWISNSSIISSVRGMQAKHVMVVADSCFSGTLVRAVKITPRTPGSLQKFVNLKARTALTSGGIEPVTDVGGGQHSVFARALLSLLEKNSGVMNGQELFVALRRQVQLNADQIPEYGDIRKAGHDGGDFLFVRQ